MSKKSHYGLGDYFDVPKTGKDDNPCPPDNMSFDGESFVVSELRKNLTEEALAEIGIKPKSLMGVGDGI